MSLDSRLPFLPKFWGSMVLVDFATRTIGIGAKVKRRNQTEPNLRIPVQAIRTLVSIYNGHHRGDIPRSTFRVLWLVVSNVSTVVPITTNVNINNQLVLVLEDLPIMRTATSEI